MCRVRSGYGALGDIPKQIQEKHVPIAGVIVNRLDLVRIPASVVENNGRLLRLVNDRFDRRFPVLPKDHSTSRTTFKRTT